MVVPEALLTDASLSTPHPGDAEGLGRLVERHRDRLVRYLARLLGDPARAEELAQEAFVRVWLAAGRYREEGRFEAYLFRIATRLARSEERRRRRHVLALARGWILPATAEPAEVPRRLEAEERATRLAAALAELPMRFRAPLLLFAVEERSLEEIGGILGVRVATVKTRLHRARVRLRTLLGESEAGGTG